MRCVPYSRVILAHASVRQTGVLLLLCSAVLLPLQLLRAQSALSAGGHGPSETADPVALGNAASPGSGTGGSFKEAPARLQAREPASGSPSNAALWNDLLLDAFQLGVHTGNYSRPGSGMGLNSGQGNGNGFGSPAGGAAGRSGGQAGGSSLDLNSLFRMASVLSRDLGAGNNRTLGTALGVLPALNQFARSGLSLPLSSSVGSFKVSYQDFLGGGGGGTGSRIGYGSPSASFDSSHFRAGKIDFSAAARVSGDSAGGGAGMSAGMSSFGGVAGGGSSLGAQAGGGTASAPGAGQGGGQNGGPGGPGGGSAGGKRPTASVSLRLSF